MKKSNIILIITAIAAAVWLVAFQWMAASVVVSFGKGKPSRFSVYQPNRHFMPEITTLNLPSFSDIEVRGTGKIEVTIERGATFAIRMDTMLASHVKSRMKYDKLVLDLSGFSEEAAGGYTITTPVLTNVILNHTGTTLIQGFSEAAITVAAHDVFPLTFKQCRLGLLTIASPDETMTQYLEIDQTNTLDRLAISLKGTGTLKLGAIGKLQNTISISDSIDIQASSRILKQLNLAGMQ